MSKPTLDELMNAMPADWRNRWCTGLCGCMGCANRSGNLSAHGYTEDDMIAYNLQNPIPQIVKPLAFRADKIALEDLADRLNAYIESKRNEQSTNKD